MIMGNYKTRMALAFLAICCLFASQVYAETIATGPIDGYYNTGMFSIFKDSLERTTRGEITLDRVSEEGTEGSLDNLARVDAGEADFAFVQKGATVLKKYANVTVIDTIAYEVANYVYPKGNKADSCDAMEDSKKFRIGVGYLSGSKVTTDVMTTVDKDYAKAAYTDTLDGIDALMKFQASELDGYFFVSMPNSGSIKRFAEKYPEYEFGDCWDGDFDEFKVNGKQLYTKVKVGKKDGYPNNFVTFAVPTVLIANSQWLKENRKFLPAIMDATTMTYKKIQSEKNLKYYPNK